MTDITTISTSELEEDLVASQNDINWCDLGLAIGITEVCGRSLQDRIRGNMEIIVVIQKELHRRSQLN